MPRYVLRRLLPGLALVAGCASQPEPLATPELQRAAVAFVEPHATTREQLLLRLGPPAWAFESGRIVTWRLEHDGVQLRPLVRTATQAPIEGLGVRWYGLVVVFDDDGVVAKFSLVEQT